MRLWWTQPAPFDLEADVVLAIRDDAVVGYGDLGDQANDGMVLWLDIRGNNRAEVHAEPSGVPSSGGRPRRRKRVADEKDVLSGPPRREGLPLDPGLVPDGDRAAEP